MAIQVLKFSMATGYGISLHDAKIDREKEELQIPSKPRRGELCFIYDDETDILFPAIKIENQITFCIAFYIYHKSFGGWKMIDFKKLPKSGTDFCEKMNACIFGFHLLEANIDMSEYDPVEAWPYGYDFELE